MLTEQQLQIFRDGESYLEMVNAIILTKEDSSLQAEVFHYQAGQHHIAKAAQKVIKARQALHCKQWVMNDSGRRFATINAFNRVYPKVV